MRKAILVIDMLNDFIKEGAPLELPEGRKIIPNIKRLLEEARKRKIPIIYICDAHRPDDTEFNQWPKHCVEGTPGAEVVEELKPEQEDIIIKKRRYSGFYSTDLDLTLRELKIDTLILTGVATNICVLHTAADAYFRGYKIIVVEDCVATLNEEAQKTGLEHIKNILGGEIKTLNETLKEL